jgi:hypothetical protein
LPRRKFNAILPVVVAAMPLVVAAVRICASNANIWFWGDQALIDIEAHSSILGRNLLGVYDRYGWHHPGPIWLLTLGVFRELGGGSSLALVLGYYVVQAAAAASIAVVAGRLRPGLTKWWTALAVVGYEWSFGIERLGTVWAPYAIALPTALLVLLVADVVANRNPWPATIGAAICATFLCQTDISTVVLVVVLVLVTPVLRMAAHVRVPERAEDRAGARRWSIEPGWGWSGGNWRLGAAALVASAVVLWLPPVIQQFSTHPGNLEAVYRFVAAHPGNHTLKTSLKAEGTVFGSFPFRLGEQGASRDASPPWLVVRPLRQSPWYLAYLSVTLVAGTYAVQRRKRAAFSLLAMSGIAMLAAGWSVRFVYGPLYPYLVLWTGALVIPAWTAWWLALAPPGASGPGLAPSGALGPGDRRGALLPRVASRRGVHFAVPVAALVAATAVSSAFVLSPVPMTGVPSLLAHRSWETVASAALAPGVKTVYVDIANPDAMPEAAAIADQALRHGRRVEINQSALYFSDPSFVRRSEAQLSVVVCCGRGDPGEPPAGMRFRRKVGGQDIYISPAAYPGRRAALARSPSTGR